MLYYLIYIDAKKLLCSPNDEEETFLHVAAECSSVETIRKISRLLPRDSAFMLSQTEDTYGRIPRDVTDDDLKRDILDHAGSYYSAFYYLKTPPQVLILYMAEDRVGAEEERECVEEFFLHRNFPVCSVRDPTADEVFSSIRKVTPADSPPSGLIVFAMMHGQSGMALKVSAKSPSDRSGIPLNEVIHCMSSSLPNRPKVGVASVY